MINKYPTLIDIRKVRQEIKLPISCKGVVFEDDKVWLRSNERGEWELPGGKLEEGETAEAAVIREMTEELGVVVDVKGIVDAYLYTITKNVPAPRQVMVLTYATELVERVGDVEHIGEAGRAEFRAFPLGEIEYLEMPDFYKAAISRAALS